jgi:KipI family sensor histidine kinase inhibitor
MLDFKVLAAGDTALVVDFGNRIDLHLSSKVLALADELRALQIAGIVEIVPTIRSLSVYYEPLVLAPATLEAHIAALVPTLRDGAHQGRTWRLPACYDVEVAPDLADVAARAGLTPAQVIERHSSVTYHVYMLGFLPGLAYLGDVPRELALPRRENPRPRIPAGSIGIASAMTCVYPKDTPCGWHLIARSPVALWDPRRPHGALLAPGDRVSFAPVSLRELEQLSQQAKDGSLVIEPGPSEPNNVRALP